MTAANFQVVRRSEQKLHLANMRPHVLLVEVFDPEVDRHKVELIPRLALNGPPDLKIEAYSVCTNSLNPHP